MDADPLALLTIIGMGLVTYATRASGLWLMARIPSSPRVEAWLNSIPGAVLISIVAPAALTKGPADALAALLTVLVAARSRNLLLSIAAGVLLALLLRRLF